MVTKIVKIVIKNKHPPLLWISPLERRGPSSVDTPVPSAEGRGELPADDVVGLVDELALVVERDRQRHDLTGPDELGRPVLAELRPRVDGLPAGVRHLVRHPADRRHVADDQDGLGLLGLRHVPLGDVLETAPEAVEDPLDVAGTDDLVHIDQGRDLGIRAARHGLVERVHLLQARRELGLDVPGGARGDRPGGLHRPGERADVAALEVPRLVQVAELLRRPRRVLVALLVQRREGLPDAVTSALLTVTNHDELDATVLVVHENFSICKHPACVYLPERHVREMTK